jgi:S1-C subfamily serine protease
MGHTRQSLRLVAQYGVIGLALAFIAVLIRPDLFAPRAPERTNGYAAAVAASAPAVVNIYTELGSDAAASVSAVPVRGGLGSGVIVSPDGYIVTNWHVIEGARQLVVQVADGRIGVPELVGSDPDTELALLRLDLPDLPYIQLGLSDTLHVGDIVLAIGNSVGLSQTVTMGIVSATGRGQLNVTTFENFIQTDAAINIGNSGGALVNTRGELVGINTAVASSGRWQRIVPEGIGFAIPVNLVRGVMAQLIEHGRVIRGFLGVEPVDISRREAVSLGLSGPAVLLQQVWGPAQDAGLEPGDILTHIDGQRVENRQQAINLVASAQPGQRMRLRVVRVGAGAVDTEAVLTERPAAQRAGSQ